MSQQDLVKFKLELKPHYEAPNPECYYKNFKFTISIGTSKIEVTVPARIILDERRGVVWATTYGDESITEWKNRYLQQGSEGLEDEVYVKIDFELMRKPLIDFLIEIQSQSRKNLSRYMKQLSDPDFKYV